MKRPYEAWHNLSSITIQNCWSHCFKDNCDNDPIIAAVEIDLETPVTTSIRDHNTRCTQFGIESLLNFEDESSDLEALSVDHLIKKVVSSSDPITDRSLDERSCEEENDAQLPLLTEQLKTFAVSVQVLENDGVLNFSIMRIMMSC